MILDALMELRATKIDPKHPKDPALVGLFGGQESSSGIDVTADSALTVAAVYAAIRIISEAIASLPLDTLSLTTGGAKIKLFQHPTYSVLHDAPNEEMSSYKFRETMQAHTLLRGNGYAEIVRNGRGVTTEMWIMDPRAVKPVRIDKKLMYEVRLINGQKVDLPPERVLHISCLGDGMIGWSPIRLARESIGLGLATERFGARFFGAGAIPGFVLQHPGELTDLARDNLRRGWMTKHGHHDSSHSLAILEEGMTAEKIGIPPEDAQFLETRKFQVVEVARWYNVPLYMLADLERATFDNIEQQKIDFWTNTMRPWLVNWEQELNRKLFPRGDAFAKFNISGALRGDLESQYKAFAIGRNWGWLSVNDIRLLLDMDPLEPDIGDQYLNPLNMVPAGSLPSTRTMRVLVDDVVGRLINREGASLDRLATKCDGDNDAWRSGVDKVYNTAKAHATKTLAPMLKLAGAEDRVEMIAGQMMDLSARRLAGSQPSGIPAALAGGADEYRRILMEVCYGNRNGRTTDTEAFRIAG